METQPKKALSFWKLVANYYLTSIFSIPLLGFIAAIIVISFIPIPLQAQAAIIFLVSLITIWYGAGYGARYVQKRYEIQNAKKLVKWAVITTVVLQVIGVLLTVITLESGLDSATVVMTLLVQIIESALWTAVFYFASKKYLLKEAAI